LVINLFLNVDPYLFPARGRKLPQETESIQIGYLREC